jgi:hypothetical protein
MEFEIHGNTELMQFASEFFDHLKHFMLDQIEFQGLISGEVVWIPKSKRPQHTAIPLQISLLSSNTILSVREFSEIPWFHSPQGRKPRDCYLQKKLYDNVLFVMFQQLDLMDLIQVGLVNKHLHKKLDQHLRKEKIPTKGTQLCELYKSQYCKYCLCISFLNFPPLYCRHDR